MAKYKNVELLDCMILSNKSDEFCEGVRFALEEIDKLPAADVEEVKNLTPCDVCAYNPPSSMGKKPCSFCVAVPRQGVEK